MADMCGDFTLAVFLFRFLHRHTSNKHQAWFLSFSFSIFLKGERSALMSIAFSLKISFLIQQHTKNHHLLLLLLTRNHDKTSPQRIIVSHNPSKTWRTAKFAGKPGKKLTFLSSGESGDEFAQSL